MAVNQIYTLVNSVVSQALGRTDLAVIDDSTLVSVGNTVLSSSSNTEAYMNTLVQRIGKVIINDRAYKSKFSFLMRDGMQWGNIVQKINVQLIEAETDEQYNLQDGKSVDMYKVNKPKALQKFFTSDTPFQMHISMTRSQLETAFTSGAEKDRFVNVVFLKVQNSLEKAMEELGRACLNNFIAEVCGVKSNLLKGTEPRAINLLDLYNKEHGLDGVGKLTVKNCMFDPEFLRFCVMKINMYSNRFTEMTKGLFNDGTIDRHTPKEFQECLVLDEFDQALKTQMQYGAYHDGYVKLDNYKPISYWQSIKKPAGINVTRASDKTPVNIDGTTVKVLSTLFDFEALGTYLNKFWSSTTPMNSAGGYYNTYYHARQLYFNDLSENFVMFYIKDVA